MQKKLTELKKTKTYIDSSLTIKQQNKTEEEPSMQTSEKFSVVTTKKKYVSMFKIFSLKKFNLLRLFQTTEKAETLPTFMEQLNSDGLIVWDLFYERLEKNVLFSKVITKTRRKFLTC